MKKEYEQPEENKETDKVNDPEAAYRAETEMTFSPPLTEEELADAITGDELREYMYQRIDELFEKRVDKQSAAAPCEYTMEEGLITRVAIYAHCYTS